MASAPTAAAPRQLLTYKEASQVLGCSLRTVLRLVEEGRLPRVRLTSRCPRIPREAVERLARGEPPTV